MKEYSEQDLKYAAQLRHEIHMEALEIARLKYPQINSVVDSHPVEEYFQEQWDYPGAWYTVVAIPHGYKNRREFVETLAKNTIENYLKNRDDLPEEPFYSLISNYPDCVVDYYITKCDEQYCGYESHRNALMKTALSIIANDWEVYFNEETATAKSISVEELFEAESKNGELNYQNAFLNPPHQNSYKIKDFEKINGVLFPNGTDCLEVFKWSTDWSDYFDDGKEWWGTICLTIYDKKADRFVIIMASATD